MTTKRKDRISNSVVTLIALVTIVIIIVCMCMAFFKGDNYVVYKFNEWYPATDKYSINNTNPEVVTIREVNPNLATSLTIGKDLEFLAIGKNEGNAIVYFDILSKDGKSKASKIYHFYVDDKLNITVNKIELAAKFYFKENDDQTHKIVVTDESALDINETEIIPEEELGKEEQTGRNYEVTAIIKRTSKTTIALEIDNADGTVYSIKKYNIELDEDDNIWFYRID
jgi:hypothetical protein